MIQGSPEWFAARCGLATASRFGDVLAKIKSGESAGRRNYRAQLVCERLTGVPSESYSNAAMEWGTKTEPYARMAYEALKGVMVHEAGFIRHESLAAGASPDGLIDDDGGIEIKCPQTATHIDTLLKGMPVEHLPQIHGTLWITGRQWWDFASFDPRLPERLQLYVERVYRNESYIKAMEAEITKFLGEVDELIAKLEKLNGIPQSM